jgi:O-antigen ligase
MIARDTMPTPVAADVDVSESRLLRYARWSLYVTFAGLPVYVVRWHYGPLPTTLLETLIAITVVLYVVARWRDGVRRPVSTPYDIPIVLLLVAGVISIFVATDHVAALGLYRAFFIEPVAIFYAAVDLLRRRQAIGQALIAFAAGSSVFAVLNIIAFFQALAVHAVHVGNAPSALYGNANYVAMYMEPPVALATGLLLYAATPRWRWAGIAWLAITGAALMLTFSKGSYLALAALGLLVVTAVPRWRVPLFVGLAAAAVAISRVPLVSDRLVNTYGSIMGRAEIYGATLAMLREHPILGVGLGGYMYKFRGHQPTPYPHDIWLTFWVELGLLGVIAFGIILIGLLWRGWRGWRFVQRYSRAAYWGSLAALVMWTVHGLVDTPYWKNDMSVEFWLLAALQVVLVREIASRRPLQEMSHSPR